MKFQADYKASKRSRKINTIKFLAESMDAAKSYVDEFLKQEFDNGVMVNIGYCYDTDIQSRRN